MTNSRLGLVGAVGVVLAACVMVVVPGVGARQAVVQIDGDDIGGVVTGPTGPEAGVWVIAETTDLPTRFNRTVVTDDEGRYVVPDLPAATYDVWVRGYGLVDSPKQQVSPGTRLDLRAVVAPDARAAAQYYPRPATGIRCSRCRGRMSSRAPDRRATASRRMCRARPYGCGG